MARCKQFRGEMFSTPLSNSNYIPILAIIIFSTNVEEKFVNKAENFFFAHKHTFIRPSAGKLEAMEIFSFQIVMAYMAKIFL